MIPNAVSLLNMLFGFFSIILAFEGKFGIAASLIMLSMILDLFDGRLARLMKKKNPLGQYLDTFADLAAFCIAPAVLFYSLIWGTNSPYPELKEYFFFKTQIFGVLLAFVFPLTGAIRLAKFSVISNENGHSDFFTGLPTTFAGGSIALIMGFNFIPSFADRVFQLWIPELIHFRLPAAVIITAFVLYSYLMISPLKFARASKDFLNFRKGIPVGRMITNLMFAPVIIFFTKYFLVIGALFYLFSMLLKNKSGHNAQNA